MQKSATEIISETIKKSLSQMIEVRNMIIENERLMKANHPEAWAVYVKMREGRVFIEP